MTTSSLVLRPPPTSEPRALGARVIAFLTFVAALATSTSYVLQPELTTVAHGLHSSVAVVTVATSAAIVGYLLGLALLVPLVDHVRANRLIAGQLVALAAGLAVAAAAPNSATLAVGLLISGASASTGAQISTLAGKHSIAARRGRAVGSVTAGISAGILLGRIVGGAVADQLGWRSMLVIFAGLCSVAAVVSFHTLPSTPGTAARSYRGTLRALPGTILAHRQLRVSALAGALWFFAFSLIWVSVSVALALPPLNVPPSVVGLYSLAGLLGIAVTRTAGALADRYGSARVVLGGLAVTFLGTATMTFALTDTALLLAALALFDAGLFSAQVANQSRVLSLDPAQPAQFNGAYMVVYFVGGSVGTAIGGSLTTSLGWPFAAVTAAAAIALAAVVSRINAATT